MVAMLRAAEEWIEVESETLGPETEDEFSEFLSSLASTVAQCKDFVDLTETVLNMYAIDERGPCGMDVNTIDYLERTLVSGASYASWVDLRDLLDEFYCLCMDQVRHNVTSVASSTLPYNLLTRTSRTLY